MQFSYFLCAELEESIGTAPILKNRDREQNFNNIYEMVDFIKSFDFVVVSLTLPKQNSLLVPILIHHFGLKCCSIISSSGNTSNCLPAFDFDASRQLPEEILEIWNNSNRKLPRIRDSSKVYDLLMPVFMNNKCYRGNSAHEYMNRSDEKMETIWLDFWRRFEEGLNDRSHFAMSVPTSAATPSAIETPAVVATPLIIDHPISAVPTEPSPLADVIVIVHGIRDIARWQTSIRDTLENAGYVVEPVNYGRMSLIEFLIPIKVFRRQAIKMVWKQLQQVSKLYPGRRVSIIAHSFGTYIIANILKEKFNFKFHKIIFCGSIVPYSFPFEQIADRFSPPILNEVGTSDPWPAFAESVTFGYGSAGTYGFKRPYVRDRFHNDAGHGYFLNSEFCAHYWLPFLSSTSVVDASRNPSNPPFWVSLSSIIKLKYIFLVTVACFIMYFGAMYSFNK